MVLIASFGFCLPTLATAERMGLPPLPIPADNPQTTEKIELGDKLFHDTRFSSTRDVSRGINSLTGTRNAPTVINAAYNESQFWDGRSPDLEDQAQHPFVNPVEMGLADHEPILAVIAADPEYQGQFELVFGVSGGKVTMDHVVKAIAAFERTVVSGDSRFDRFYFGGEADALTEQEQRGFEVFLGQGRCVSCHTLEQDFALFSDQKFHNIGVGVNELGDKVVPLAKAFLVAKAEGTDVDVAVLTDVDTSHLGRFAVDEDVTQLGAFKTSTLRNIAVTAPYMHDGSITTLRDVVVHYNNGGALNPDQPITPYLSGGIRPLALTDDQIDDLVAFMETLTSPEFEHAAGAGTSAKAE
jgi:cytochrome c peroxidase